MMGLGARHWHYARMKERGQMQQIDMPGVAARVEAVRRISQLTRDAFAKSIGLDPSSYSKVMNSTKPLKIEYGFNLAVRWGVTMDFVYRGDLSRMDPEMRNSIMSALTAAQE